jgi:hypothetical protein
MEGKIKYFLGCFYFIIFVGMDQFHLKKLLLRVNVPIALHIVYGQYTNRAIQICLPSDMKILLVKLIYYYKKI